MTLTTYATAPMQLERTPLHEWSIPTYAAVPTVVASVLPPAPAAIAVPAGSHRERRVPPASGSAVRFAGWELDLIERRLIAPGGGTARLPGLEFALLKVFVIRARQPLARIELARALARDRDTRLSGRSVDSYVSRVRRRFDRGGATLLITTVWGTGYRFDADVAWM